MASQPPAKRKAAKRADNQARHRGQKGKAPPASAAGKRLSAARQALRDQLMVQRVAEDWPWEAIAAEAGISVAAARKAVAKRIADAPLNLKSDPVEVVERIFEGYQLSIGSFQALSAAAAESNNLAASVGALKGANDAREKLLALLQATGRLPQEMGTLRHLIDIRAIAVRMLDVMEDFERDMVLALGLQEDEERREAARAAAGKVRATFAELMGLDDPSVDGTAAEIPETTAEPG